MIDLFPSKKRGWRFLCTVSPKLCIIFERWYQMMARLQSEGHTPKKRKQRKTKDKRIPKENHPSSVFETVDGRNPAPVGKVVYPMIYRLLYIRGGSPDF